MKKNTKVGIFISIMVLSMYLNIENMVPLLLADMQKTFPNASVVSIQNVYSTIMIVELFTNLTVGWFASKLSKRQIVIMFQGGTVLGGLIAFFFGKSLAVLYTSSVIIGFSAAIISTISKSIITENYTDTNEAAKVMGAQQMIQAIGTILLNLLTGVLALHGWRYGYLSFLFGFISLLSGIFLLPDGPKEQRKVLSDGRKVKMWNKHLIHNVIVTLVFVMLHMTYSYNISYLVEENGFGNVAVASYLSSIQQIMLFIAAILLSKVVAKLKKWTLSVCFGLETLGFAIIAFSNNIWLTIFGIIISSFAQGVFAPKVYLDVARQSDSSVVTASMAMVNAGASLGVYLVPYLITAPSVIFGNGANARFITAMIGLVVLFVVEIIYQNRADKNA